MTTIDVRRTRPVTLPRVEPRRALVVGFWTALALGVALRVWTRSPLWLDEAQSVAIARLPLVGGHGPTLWLGLRQDGSPPLYYVLLHGWMTLFGHSAVAVRSMSGVTAILALPVLWRLASGLGGRAVGATAVLLLASSPFAVRFATETRMYSLIVLLTALGGLALRRLLLSGPSIGRVLAVAAVTGALALTHYWSFFLLATVAVGLVARRRWVALGAMALGGIPFLPWVPSFLYQLKHTGTPWAGPAAYSAVVHAFADWAGGDTTVGRVLLLIVFALLALGLFGHPLDERRILLDLRGRSPATMLAALTVGTLLVAVTINLLVGGAWQDRYTAVAFVPFLIWMSLGIRALADRRAAIVVVGIATFLGLVGSVPNVTTNRTSAASVAAAIKANIRPGDLVVACPDQLGPALSRLVPASVTVLGIPTLQPANRVDWVDYAHRQRTADPAALAAALTAMAGPRGHVLLDVNAAYLTYQTLCTKLQKSFDAERRPGRTLVVDTGKTFENSTLIEYGPPGAR